MKLEVGQELYFVPSIYRRGDPHHLTVKSVGRKWAKLSDGKRVSIETLCVDGGDHSSPGKCYLSVEAFESKKALLSLWATFRSRVSNFKIHSEVTAQDIHSAAKLLKIEIGDWN